ncbi:MAG: UDP-N-acetylglucosamine 1-carboxyvinyltransferase [Deltaproteobacteria bacterium]|nr:UDP-N-acetylglucosamine 1-carboxyvinyltransferase [Deltaproteobacteria bacterium]
MDSLVVEGGQILKGKVEVPPAKNAALPLLCLSLLTAEKVSFESLPDVADIQSMQKMLEHLGVEKLDKNLFQCKTIKSVQAPYEWVRKMRASILVLGPLLARAGRAEVSMPGGCAIGERPVGIHLDGLRAMGATINLENGYIQAECKKLRGTKFVLDFPTVTGTINLVTAAALAEGESLLENVACEPEVVEIVQALRQMGAKISGEGTSQIKITGVPKLNGLKWQIQPDRIQLLTYLAAGALTGGEVECTPYRQGTLNAVVQKFRELGCEMIETSESLRLKAPQRLKSIHLETAPFPGFPTDGQAQFMACTTLAAGSSTIRELVFENRFQHVAELRRMGAKIEVDGNTAVISGVDHLSGASVMASDLRASASLVLAGLSAHGKTKVLRVYHLDRGYEMLEAKLRKLGAKITREKE